jgi:hypothetical protein
LLHCTPPPPAQNSACNCTLPIAHFCMLMWRVLSMHTPAEG